MAKFCEITWNDMHGFMVENGLLLLNPPVTDRDCKVVNWDLLSQPGFIEPGHVVKVPAIDLYRPYKTGEMVYGKRVYMQGSDKQLTLRIYTTINPWEGAVRQKGTDAIRVTLFWREIIVKGDEEVAMPSKLIGGSTKCLRVMGWRKNVGDRLLDWPTLLGPECPKCSRPMAEREGQRGKFWGCTGYPTCKGTLNIGDDGEPIMPPAVTPSNGPTCECGKPMKERQGKFGKFYGCTGYPSCQKTRKVA